MGLGFWRFILSGISKGKVTNLKISEVFFLKPLMCCWCGASVVMKFYNFLILLISTLAIFLIFCIMKEDNGLFHKKKKNSRIFQISVRVEGKFCPSLGELEILLVGVYRVVKTWGGGVILTKNNILLILTTKHQLKPKLGWPVCQKGGGN